AGAAEEEDFFQARVTGTVYDTNGDIMLGTTVIEKGTNNGTVTNEYGQYTLSVGGDATLVFSFIGMETQEVAVNNRTKVDVTMEFDLETLEELVVVGYGTQKKRDVTAAIGGVSAAEIAELPVSNATQALQGRVAGLDIAPTGGRPGQEPRIIVRGRRSIEASNDPLFVVDGIPLTGSIFDFNQQNIESIEVLKDAAATAIYGSRGANGVILITTKKGQTGAPQISYNGYYGPTSILNEVDMMNGAEFADLKRESRRRRADGSFGWDGSIPPDSEVFEDPAEFASLAQNPTRSTDYQDLIFQTGSRMDHQLSIMGGTENTQYSAQAGYFNEEGIIEGIDFQRFTLNLSVDQKVGERFRFGASTMLSRSIQNWGSRSTLSEALANNPLGVPFDDEGNLLFLPIADGIRTNPLNELVDGALIDERTYNRIFASIYAELELLEGLKYRVNFGPDIRIGPNMLPSNSDNHVGRIFQASETNARRGAPPRGIIGNGEEFSYTLENIVTYNKNFGGDHDFGLTLLQSIQGFREEGSQFRADGIPVETMEVFNFGAAESITQFGSELREWSLASFMGRVNYTFRGKYILQATLRADGSSRLAEGNKWGYFPGVSAGWRLSDEAFLQGINVIDELKLRASYGEVGNTGINPYDTRGALSRSTYVFGDEPAFGFALNDIPNDELGWERTSTLDIGLDFGLFNSRLTGSIDFYQSTTTDLLLRRQIPWTSGYQQVLTNVGKTRNTGIEITLSSVNIDQTSGLRWTTDMNFTSNNEQILELFNGAVDDVGNEWFIGEPLNVFFDYEKVGIWQIDEVDEARDFDNSLPGFIKVADLNDNGVSDPEDRKVLGTDVPDWQMGLTNRFEYKGIDFSFFMYFRIGQMLRSRFHDSNNSLFARYNNLDVNYWTPDNPTNEFPRPNLNQERPEYVSTLRYFDGSFMKMRNITLGYTLPSAWAEAAKIGSARIYAMADQPFFIASYESFDPETDDDVASNQLPSSRAFLFGLQLSF
ncbi:MAG: TonB-dependent receptor, partial [Bacteroidota bacterium]